MRGHGAIHFAMHIAHEPSLHTMVSRAHLSTRSEHLHSGKCPQKREPSPTRNASRLPLCNPFPYALDIGAAPFSAAALASASLASFKRLATF